MHVLGPGLAILVATLLVVRDIRVRERRVAASHHAPRLSEMALPPSLLESFSGESTPERRHRVRSGVALLVITAVVAAGVFGAIYAGLRALG